MTSELSTTSTRALFSLPADAVVTGVTALHRHGVEVADAWPIRAVTASSAQTRRADVRLIRARRVPASTDRLAHPLPAWLAAGAELDLVELVAAADALVRLQHCTLAELQAAGQGATGRGCRTLHRAAGLARERVDSMPESHLRLCLVLAGLPEPRCNVTLGDDHGVIGRVDLLIEEFGVILEYDGDQHRDRGQWNLDLDRDDRFGAADFTTVRITRDRMRRPRDVVGRVYVRLVERGYAGPPPRFDPEWCALFERRE